MKAHALLFDLDGTLTAPGAIDFSEIRRCIGCPADQPILEYTAGLHRKDRRNVLDILEVFELEAAERSRPNAGAEDLLGWLERRRIPYGLVTRNGMKAVAKTLAHFTPTSRDGFRVIVTREHAAPKPDPAGIHLAARAMNAIPQEMLVVGDYRFDIIAGRNAGSLTAFLTNGAEAIPLILDPQPDFVIRTLSEIRRILDP